MQKGDHWREWEIIELLGSGSFGKVYRIRRSGFDGFTEESALKVIRIPQNESDYQSVLKDGMDEKSASVYFETMVNELSREFTLMSSLKGNSNIVSFEDYEVNRLTDRYGWEIIIRMELLEPLNESISNYGITAEEIAKVGIDICKALELCEKESIIHRDIKPENIFVSKYGDYKLGDFGIAKKLENATYSHTQMGTLSYMAPEIYKGLPYNSTVDIYSLGLVLYRLLNDNRYPFMPPYPEPVTFQDRERAREKRMNGDRMPAPVNASRDMASVILKACEYDPADRFQDAASMRAALEAVLDGTFDEATLPMPVKQTQSESGSGSTLPAFIAKNKMLIGIAAAVLLVLLIALPSMLPKGWDETEQVPADEETAQEEEAGEPEEEPAEQPAEQAPYDAENAAINFPEYSGDTITVSSSEEFLDAVKNAADGTTIELASGNYSFDEPVSINGSNLKILGTGDSKPVLDAAIVIGGKNNMLENISVYLTDYEKAYGGEMADAVSVQSYSGGNTFMRDVDITIRYHGTNIQKGIEHTSPLYIENCFVDVGDINDNDWVGYCCVAVGSKFVSLNSTFYSNDIALGLWPAAEDLYTDEEIQALLDNNSFKASVNIG